MQFQWFRVSCLLVCHTFSQVRESVTGNDRVSTLQRCHLSYLKSHGHVFIFSQDSPIWGVKTDFATWPATGCGCTLHIPWSANTVQRKDGHLKRGNGPCTIRHNNMNNTDRGEFSLLIFFFNSLFQKREGPQQEPGQQFPQIIWVQYSRKPHIHMEPNGQPHSADPQPSVLHPSHGRASGTNQETTPRTRENWEPKQNHNSQTNTGDYHYC